VERSINPFAVFFVNSLYRLRDIQVNLEQGGGFDMNSKRF